MYDFFVEEAARINSDESINEGFWTDAQVRRLTNSRLDKSAASSRDIIKVHNLLINLDDTIGAVQKLRNSAKTKTQAKGITNIGPHHTSYSREELDVKLAELKENRKAIEALYKSMGGDNTYYMALTAQAAKDSANAQILQAMNSY